MKRRLRVAFVNLRADTDWHHIVMVPLGVMYVAGAVRRAFGDRVGLSLFDMTTCPHFERADDPLRAFLERERPDVVGIRGFSTQAAEFPIVARAAKAAHPACVVVAGGPHAATGSPALYAEPTIDRVCAAEGEQTFVDVIGGILDGASLDEVAGLGRFDGTAPVINPRRLIEDLDGLPFPDYALLELDAYQGHTTMTDFGARHRYTSIFTSRGCHYRCTYCHDNFGKRVRYRSAENVLEEMAWLMETQGVREFHIVDDIFNADKARAIAIFDGIVQRGWDVSLAFPNGLRADRMDEEFVSAARAAGTYHWALAVETATPRLQKLVKKMNKLDRVFETIRLSDRYGVFTTTFNMLGFPGETEDEMAATVDFNVRSAAHVAFFFVVTPFEGTAMRDELSLDALANAPEATTLGYMGFTAESDDHGSLSPIPRPRIEAIMRDAKERFYFGDEHRIARMMDLSPTTHRAAELAIHLDRQMVAVGLTLDTIAASRVAARMDRLFETARQEDPERCAHLPRLGTPAP